MDRLIFGTVLGVSPVDEDHNYLAKREEAHQINGTTSQVQSYRKKMTDKELLMSNGSKEGFARVIPFHDSVNVDIPRWVLLY